jgi:hypothetical protein
MMLTGWALSQQAASRPALATESLEAMKGRIQAILAKCPEGREADEYRRRLDWVEKAEPQIVRRIRSLQSAALARMLDSVSRDDREESARGHADADATDMLLRAQDIFTEALMLPDLPEEGKEALRQYYIAAFASAEERVMGAAGAAASVLGEDDRSEVCRLCAVIPLLRIPDRAWSGNDVDALPKWMKEPQAARTLEEFAERLRRPTAALTFAQRATGREWTTAEKCDYLDGVLRTLLADEDYVGAGPWCQSLIDFSEGVGESERAMDARCQMVGIREKSGSPLLAAMEARSAMDAHSDSPSWGKAAVLRMKNLYAADRLKEVTEEAGKYVSDERAQSYKPQIIYMAWVASRRDADSHGAEQWQKMFLEQFPDHPLGADMYFASAMSAMAGGDYSEADRLLEIVVYKYPQTGVAAKARAIEDRLAKREGNGKQP